MIESLNPEQQQAVVTDASHALVLAGAGSGKTKVLTTRIAWLISNGYCSPGGLLAVTFTNKAAREMLDRLAALLPLSTRGMWVGTFHGLCNRLLRTHHQDAGLAQNFQILDSSDQLSAIKRLLKANQVDTDNFPPKELQRFINHHKEKGLRADSVIPWDAHSRHQLELYHAYETQCEREGVVDFAELLLRSYELLKRNQLLREHYQRRFKYILIDEFQDTNELQYQWLRLLMGEQSKVFAVGDDDQSIYAFRGAKVDNMLHYEKNFAKGNVIRLEQNYRSFGHILNAANHFIKQNENRLGKSLWTSRGDGEPIRVVELADAQEEAQWVLDEVKALINEEGYAYQEMAVLYRSNAQSRAFEHAFMRAGIPYRVYGGLRFYERQEIKHVLAYLRLIASIHDDTSFLRVVNFPARGIGARSLGVLTDHAQNIGCSLALAVEAVEGRARNNFLKFLQMIEDFSKTADQVSLPELIEHVIQHSGIQEFYENERDGQDRLENLNELVNAAKVFVFEESFEGYTATQEAPENIQQDHELIQGHLTALNSFLSYASLESGDNQAEHGMQAIQLMTIHAAKGLEFNAVFLTGLEEGLFPHENSLAERDGLQEERRLMYVAITRAKQRLYLSGAQARMIYGQTRYSMRSSFLEELPESSLKWLSPKAVATTAPNLNFNSNTQKTHKKPALSLGVKVGEQLIKVGQTVEHPRFGQGVVLHLSGQAEDANARIFFTTAGEKTLALSVAKLTVK